MLSALTTALTGLKAFVTKLDVNANNIANVNTDNFKKSRVELQESTAGGVEVTISRVNTSGMLMEPDARTGQPQESSNVTIEEEIAEQITARYAYEANILSVKTAEEMQKTLFDIKA